MKGRGIFFMPPSPRPSPIKRAREIFILHFIAVRGHLSERSLRIIHFRNMSPYSPFQKGVSVLSISETCLPILYFRKESPYYPFQKHVSLFSISERCLRIIFSIIPRPWWEGMKGRGIFFVLPSPRPSPIKRAREILS
jgi:hypothetical protein